MTQSLSCDYRIGCFLQGLPNDTCCTKRNILAMKCDLFHSYEENGQKLLYDRVRLFSVVPPPLCDEVSNVLLESTWKQLTANISNSWIWVIEQFSIIYWVIAQRVEYNPAHSHLFIPLFQDGTQSSLHAASRQASHPSTNHSGPCLALIVLHHIWCRFSG